MSTTVKTVDLRVTSANFVKGTKNATTATKKLDQAAIKASSDISRFKKNIGAGQEFEKFKAQAKSLAIVLTGAFVAVIAIAKKAKSAFQEFESATNDMLKVTDVNLSQITKTIKAIPANLGNSTELMRGYYATFSAGITDQKKALDTLTTASKASRAAHVGQGQTITATTKLMAGFSDQIKNAADATDLLFAIEQGGQTNFAALVPVIGELAKGARDVKVNVNEMGAALAQTTQFAGSTAQAATQVGQLFNEINKPTGELEKTFKKLGYGSGVATVGTLGFTKTLKLLKEAAGGSDASFKALFGSIEAGKAAVSIADQDFAGFNDRLNIMANRAGNTEKYFNAWKNSMEGVEATYKAKLQNILIEMGAELMPIVIKAMKNFSIWLDKNQTGLIAAAKSFADFATSLGQVAGVIIPLLPSLLKFYGLWKVTQGMASLLKWLSSYRTGVLAAKAAEIAADKYRATHLGMINKTTAATKRATAATKAWTIAGRANIAIAAGYIGWETYQAVQIGIAKNKETTAMFLKEGRAQNQKSKISKDIGHLLTLQDQAKNNDWDNANPITAANNLKSTKDQLKKIEQNIIKIQNIWAKSTDQDIISKMNRDLKRAKSLSDDIRSKVQAFENPAKEVQAFENSSKEVQAHEIKNQKINALDLKLFKKQKARIAALLKLYKETPTEQNYGTAKAEFTQMQENSIGVGLEQAKAAENELQDLKKQNLDDIEKRQKKMADNLKMSVAQIAAQIIKNGKISKEQVGGAFVGAVGSIFGPIGQVLGQAIGSVMGRALDKDSEKEFYNSLKEIAAGLAKFKAALEFQNSTASVKTDKYYQQGQRINDLFAMRQQALLDYRYWERKKTRDGSSEKNAMKYLSLATRYSNEILALAGSNAELEKALINYSYELKAQLEELKKTRDLFTRDFNEEDLNLGNFSAMLTTVQIEIKKMGKGFEMGNLDQALYNEELLKLKNEEWRLQQKVIEKMKGQIRDLESIQKGYKDLQKSAEDLLTQRTRKNWGVTDYSNFYQTQAKDYAALDPLSLEALDLAKEQFKTLQKIENLNISQLNALDSSKTSLLKMVEDLTLSKLNVKRSFADYEDEYTKLKAGALTGDTTKISEFQAFSRNYLEIAQGFYKSSDDYQNLFNSVMADFTAITSGIDAQTAALSDTSQISQLLNGFAISLDTPIATLDLSIQDLTSAMWDVANSLNDGLKVVSPELIIQPKPLNGGFEFVITDPNWRPPPIRAFADGGISTGPNSGYPVKLHGTEAVIPLKNGMVPVKLSTSGQSQVELIKVIEKQNQLLGELIDITRANDSGNSVVVIDSASIANEAVKTVVEGSRRGIQNIQGA